MNKDIIDKKSKSFIAAYIIILIVYILSFFIIPFKRNAVSWISFAFTIIAVIASMLISLYAFMKCETVISKIYGYPIFFVGSMYAIIQLVLGIIVCGIDRFIDIPYWLMLLMSILLFGFTVLGIIITDNARDIVEIIDESESNNIENMGIMIGEISNILRLCEDIDTKKKLEKLKEEFTYSDPVTNAKTEAIEKKIKYMISNLKTYIESDNKDEKIHLIKEISNVLAERNYVCKKEKKR